MKPIREMEKLLGQAELQEAFHDNRRGIVIQHSHRSPKGGWLETIMNQVIYQNPLSGQ